MHFGEYLISKKLITTEQLNCALEQQKEHNRPMGKFAQKMGFIDRKDSVRVLLEQTRSGERYGDIAVEKGFMTREQVGHVLEEKNRDSVMLGKILVQNGALTKTQLLQALKSYMSEVQTG